ncbi:MAG: hypothetical protein HYW25_01535 [Candidatus Aenigmarchaeota archaeon]|nr:hypothetical protein [Candidatus Aenigmarchaeota archaeon]
MACKTCGGETKDWKCDICGSESKVHVEDHGCGGEHCMPKCMSCGEAEVLCEC